MLSALLDKIRSYVGIYNKLYMKIVNSNSQFQKQHILFNKGIDKVYSTNRLQSYINGCPRLAKTLLKEQENIY